MRVFQKAIGAIVEYKVGLVLEKLKQENIIFQWGQFEKFSQEDRKGIDFVIYLPSEKLFLQVKHRIQKEKVNHRRFNQIQPGIWFERRKKIKEGVFWIEIPADELLSGIEEKIKKILEISKYKKIKLGRS